MMSRGRIVRVHADASTTFLAVKAFDVGLEGEQEAIEAVRACFPGLCPRHMSATERLSATAVAFLDLQHGEVRNRLGNPRQSGLHRGQADVGAAGPIPG